MNGDTEREGKRGSRKRRAITCRVVLAVFAALGAWMANLGQRPLAVSIDGRVRYLEVRHLQGTIVTLQLPNPLEATISRWGQNLKSVAGRPLSGGFPMPGPLTISNQRKQPLHVFVVEYAVKPSDGPTNRIIRAELVSTDGGVVPLVQVGDGGFGFRGRSFAYWVLDGLTNALSDAPSLRVYFPEESPVNIPVERK